MTGDPPGQGETGSAGYRRPPAATRFVKGQSGNPRGRPSGRHRQLPYDTVLGQMVTVREDGRERRVTAAEAFLLQLTRKGLAGDSAAARASLDAIETARAARRARVVQPSRLRVVLMSFGVGTALQHLGMATKRNRLDEKRVRWELKPWIVEAALARMAPRQLDIAQQQEVWTNTHRPETVRWPEWWVWRGSGEQGA